MRSVRFLLLWVVIALFVAGCQEKGDLESVENQATKTPTIDFGFVESRHPCQKKSDCVLMRIGVCGYVQAIHVTQIDEAEAYTRREKMAHPLVQCSPQLPFDAYEALCLNRQCRAVVRGYDLILEVPEQPIAGRPFWIGMGFRYHTDIEELDARFILPEGMQVIQGQETWRGPVEAERDYVFWVEVMTNRAGELYVTGWTGIKKGEPGIPPLSWSDYIEVSLPSALTPWPDVERILPTPTPAP